MPSLLNAIAGLIAASTTVTADIIMPIQEGASERALKFQPLMDFDTDSCFNTAAIDPAGWTNPGLRYKRDGITEFCRETDRLANSNVYVRQRCNNGWCALMYDYYFEKDVSVAGAPHPRLGWVDGSGHRHEWENVVVFVKDEQLMGVATSCHDGYGSGDTAPRVQDGTLQPLVVYHKDGGLTHCIRLAKADEPAEHGWIRSPLVGWDFWPGTTRDKLEQAWPSPGISPKIDKEFGNWLGKAKGKLGIADAFDPHLDA